MLSLFNQFSAVAIIVVGFVVLLAVLLKRIPDGWRLPLIVAGLGGLAGVFLFLFPSQVDPVAASEVGMILDGGNGRFVFIELYSDY